MEIISETIDDTHETAKKLLKDTKPSADRATVVGFSGQLGVGKTEFIRGLLRSAGIEDTVTSPTYTIETVYELPETDFKRAYHVDAYRLDSGGDLHDIGFEDRLTDPKNLILVEWADSVDGMLPRDTIFVEITIEDTDRVISIGNEQSE
jgi:tRNA threonylcarbamoyladenosine biosynthesis protein TsaE